MKQNRKQCHSHPSIALVLLLFTAVSAHAYDAEIAWRPVSTAMGYKIYIRQEGQQYGAGISTPGSAGADGLLRYVATGLPSGASYFRIASYNGAGESGWSNEIGIEASGSSSAASPTPTATATRTSTPVPTPTTISAGGCSAVLVMPGSGGVVTGTTSGASTLAGSCALTGNSPERVVQWIPSASGTAVIETCGSGTNFDTVLYLRGGTCTSGEIACNDDTAGCTVNDGSGVDRGSRLTVSVTAGQAYYIVVDGWNTKAGDFSLTAWIPVPIAPTATATRTPSFTASPGTPTHTQTFSPTPTPTPSGGCGAPIQIPATGGLFTGTTSGASALASSCTLSSNSPEVVYRWTPQTSGTATIETCGTGTDFDTVLYMRNASTASCTSGPDMACNDDAAGCPVNDGSGVDRGSRLTVSVTAGHTYFVVVDGWNTASGTYSLRVAAPAAPTASWTATATRTRTATPTWTFTPTPSSRKASDRGPKKK